MTKKKKGIKIKHLVFYKLIMGKPQSLSNSDNPSGVERNPLVTVEEESSLLNPPEATDPFVEYLLTTMLEAERTRYEVDVMNRSSFLRIAALNEETLLQEFEKYSNARKPVVGDDWDVQDEETWCILRNEKAARVGIYTIVTLVQQRRTNANIPPNIQQLTGTALKEEIDELKARRTSLKEPKATRLQFLQEELKIRRLGLPDRNGPLIRPELRMPEDRREGKAKDRSIWTPDVRAVSLETNKKMKKTSETE